MSAVECWLIDGWNVLHGLAASSKFPKALTSEKLLSLLSDFAAEHGCRMVAIWDGHGPGGDARLQLPVSASVESIYSGDKTADAVLERRLYEGRERGVFVVITDDGAMTRIARGSGARVFSVARFGEMIGELRASRREKTDRSKADEHGFNRPFDKLLP